MILSVGTDLVEVARIRRILGEQGERFLARVLTEGERRYCARKSDPAPSVAARFAAKEAVLKVLGTGLAQGLSWQGIEVVRDAHGAPAVRLHGTAAARARRLGIERVHLSLAHTKEHALAFALAEGAARP